MADNLENKKHLVQNWFEELRNDICKAFEFCELEVTGGNGSENMSSGRFKRVQWERSQNEDGSDGGGGIMSVMRGRVFEKVGVNISTVEGVFSNDVREQIPGASIDPHFWASGISVVAHPRSPFVPIAHMNTRMIVTTKHWFGGGGDLTPVYPVDQDTKDFHSTFRIICSKHDKGYYGESYYSKFKTWCDEYFFLPHRGESRGVGGIFYDYLDTGNWEVDFEFTQDVGKGFLKIYPEIVQRHMNKNWTPEHVEQQQLKRGRYVEFNLIHDRGTKFGLITGGNIDAILMSLPPTAAWP